MSEFIIAVDFDGTIVTHDYPHIGRCVGALPWLQAFAEAGAKLILLTMRSDNPHALKQAVQFCRDGGVEFWAVNDNPTQTSWTTSRKVYAHLYIDDAAFGCPLIYSGEDQPYVDWAIVGPAVLEQLRTVGLTSPMDGPELVARVEKFARQVHSQQRYGNKPYTYHLEAVAALVRSYGPLYEAAAWLHDTVEGHPSVSLPFIKHRFGEVVGSAVSNLTDPPGRNRAERKSGSHAKLAVCHCPISLVVKAADRLANLRECRASGRLDKSRMYVDEHADFRHAVKRAWACPEIWAEIEMLVEQMRADLAGTD